MSIRVRNLIELRKPVEVIAAKTFPIGRQWIWKDANGKYFFCIKNRTYDSIVEIPEEEVPAWKKALS